MRSVPRRSPGTSRSHGPAGPARPLRLRPSPRGGPSGPRPPACGPGCRCGPTRRAAVPGIGPGPCRTRCPSRCLPVLPEGCPGCRRRGCPLICSGLSESRTVTVISQKLSPVSPVYVLMVLILFLHLSGGAGAFWVCFPAPGLAYRFRPVCSSSMRAKYSSPPPPTGCRLTQSPRAQRSGSSPR